MPKYVTRMAKSGESESYAVKDTGAREMINAEATARQEAVSAEATARQEAVSAEATAREAADTAEAATRAAVEADLRNITNEIEDALSISYIFKTLVIKADLTVPATITPFSAKKNNRIYVIVDGEAVTGSLSIYFRYSGESSTTYIGTINKGTKTYYNASKDIDYVAFYSDSHGQGQMTIEAAVVKANAIERVAYTGDFVAGMDGKKASTCVFTAISGSVGHDVLDYPISIPKYNKFAVKINGEAFNGNSTCTLYFVYSDSDSWITIGTIGIDEEIILMAGKDITHIGLYGTNLTVNKDVCINVCLLSGDGATDASGNTIAAHGKNIISEPFRCGEYSSGILEPKLNSSGNAYIAPFSVQPDTYYTLSTSEDAEDPNSAYYVIQLASDYSRITGSSGMNKSALPYTFKTEQNTAYVGIMTYSSLSNGWYKTIPSWIQVEEGVHATEYVNPYTIQKDRIEFDYIREKINNEYGSSSANLIKEGFMCGEYSQANGFKIKSSGNNAAIPPFAVKPDTPYTLSLPYHEFETPNVFFYIVFLDAGKNVIYYSGSIYMNTGIRYLKKTITSPAAAAYAGIMTYSSASGQNNWQKTIPSWIQFEEGEEATGHVEDYVQSTSRVQNFDVLPSYYDGYIAKKAARINEIAKTCAANSEIFIFITDQHWILNMQNSPGLINYIDNHCFIPRIFNGGDTEDHISIEYIRTLRNHFKNKIYYVMGNHEWFGAEGDMMYYYADSCNSDQIGNNKEHYYYVDNPQTKTRYIVLNAYINEGTETADIQAIYTADERQWLENTALDIENGWSVIVFTHAIDNGVAYAAEVKGILDSAKNNGKDIIAVFQGHAHWDGVCHTTGGIPIIITTCDKNASWYNEGTNMEPWLERDRANGTIYEQAFDVVVIDREQKVIHAVRIGAKAMDNNDIWSAAASGFSDAGVFEERTISYS